MDNEKKVCLRKSFWNILQLLKVREKRYGEFFMWLTTTSFIVGASKYRFLADISEIDPSYSNFSFGVKKYGYFYLLCDVLQLVQNLLILSHKYKPTFGEIKVSTTKNHM